MTENKRTIDEYDYYRLALKKREEGYIFESVSLLNNIIDEGSKNMEVFATLGDVYFEIGLYSLCENAWFKYLSMSVRDDDKIRAYNALGASFCARNENYLMSHYFDLEFSLNPKKEQDYDYVLYDLLDYHKECYPDFYVAYPIEGLSDKNLFVSANDLLNKGRMEDGMKRLDLVSPNSEDYDDAVYRYSACMKENGATLEEIRSYLITKLDRAINKGKIALYVAETFDREQAEEQKPYLLLSLEHGLDDPSDYYILAGFLARQNEIALSKKALDESLDLNPFEVRSIYLYGAIYYNEGDYKTSERYFKMGYDLCRDNVNLFYYNLCRSQSLRADYPQIPLSYSYPEKKAVTFISQTASLVLSGKTIFKRYDPTELERIADYGLSFPNNLREDAIKAFIINGTPRLRSFYVSALLSQNVGNASKWNIIEALVSIGYNKRLDVVFDGIYIKTRLYKASFGTAQKTVFTNAYAKAVARMLPFSEDLSGVKQTAEHIYYTLERLGNLDKAVDANALSAVIAKVTDGKKFSASVLYKLFDTDKKAVGEIMNLLADEKNEKDN